MICVDAKKRGCEDDVDVRIICVDAKNCEDRFGDEKM